MDNLDNSWSEPRLLQQLAAVISANGTNGSEPGVSTQTQLVLEILMVLMCLGAVTGNILVIVIVAATKTFHSVTSVLIMNLAISDLLVGIGVMPFVALSIMNPGWVDCTDLCLYVGYTSSVYCTASVLTLAAIALDRYHSIIYCLRYSSRCTPWRICGVVLWIWLQALATSCPPLLGWSSFSYVSPMYSCTVNWASSPSYTAFMAALSYLIPAVVILFCYVNIVKVARSHARRIHTLEDAVQRCRNLTSDCAPGETSDQHSGCLHSPSTLIYHISGQFVSHVGTGEDDYINSALPEATTEQRRSASRRFFSFLAQSACQFPLQQHQSHQGVVRLFMVIAAFFLCWTPYICVALIQATETAIAGQPTLVSASGITFSYWLLLLNSDINPLLYALLSKRFQSALQGLRQKISARLGKVVGRGDEARAEGDDGRSSDPSTLTSTHRGLASSSDNSKSLCSPSIFTVSADFQHQPEEHLCSVCHPQKSSSAWQDAGGDRRVDCLQVPTRPQESSTLSFSGVTEERQATFFYGQITVRVEHDIS